VDGAIGPAFGPVAVPPLPLSHNADHGSVGGCVGARGAHLASGQQAPERSPGPWSMGESGDGCVSAASPQAKQGSANTRGQANGTLVSQLDEFFRRGTPRATGRCPRAPLAVRLEQYLAAWARARGISSGSSPRLVSEHAVRRTAASPSPQRAEGANRTSGMREVVLLWRGISIEVLLEGTDVSEAGFVNTAQTECSWAEARLAIASAVARAESGPLDAFLDALLEVWSEDVPMRGGRGGVRKAPSAPVTARWAKSSSIADMADVASSTPLADAGAEVMHGGPPDAAPASPPASDLASSSGSGLAAPRSDGDISTFANWLAERPPLWRFDHATRGLGWDFPLAKAEKRELLLLQLFAEEGERQAQLAALRAQLPLALDNTK